MKEVILKATDGTEMVMTIFEPAQKGEDCVASIKVKELTPNFKVGNWVCDRRTSLIFRVTGIGEGKYYSLYHDEDSSTNSLYCRLATFIEIGTHLIREAERRGFKEGVWVRIKLPRMSREVTLSGKLEYLPNWNATRDALSCGGDIIWDAQDGWAEIIPSKKKLPRTKYEFVQFINAWEYRGKDMNMPTFLNDYED